MPRVSPTRGSVATSRAGPGRAAAHAWHAASRSSSIQASGRSGPAKASIAPSFQCPATPFPGPRAAFSGTNGQPRGRSSRYGRCSFARSSQPVHHAGSYCGATRRNSPRHGWRARWGTPSMSAARPGGGAAASNPNSERTPSTSTSSSGSPMALSKHHVIRPVQIPRLVSSAYRQPPMRVVSGKSTGSTPGSHGWGAVAAAGSPVRDHLPANHL